MALPILLNYILAILARADWSFSSATFGDRRSPTRGPCNSDCNMCYIPSHPLAGGGGIFLLEPSGKPSLQKSQVKPPPPSSGPSRTFYHPKWLHVIILNVCPRTYCHGVSDAGMDHEPSLEQQCTAVDSVGHGPGRAEFRFLLCLVVKLTG